MIARLKTQDVESSVTKKKVSQIIHKHLTQEIPKDFEIFDGVSFGIKYYNMSKEPCWSVLIYSCQTRAGAGKIICVSKKTGKVIYDGPTNYE